jgi:hypothetical protein
MGQYCRARNMVNRLLTKSIKVNIASTAESQWNKGAIEMKKTRTRTGFWSWLMGSGWSTAGGNG